MKFVEGGYISPGEHITLPEPHCTQCIYAFMTREQAKIFGFNTGDSMSEFKARKLVIGRAQPGDRLVLCDEETGQPLEGQTDLKLNSPSNGCPTVTVTFEVWGPHGVRFMSDPRPEH